MKGRSEGKEGEEERKGGGGGRKKREAEGEKKGKKIHYTKSHFTEMWSQKPYQPTKLKTS